jgi:serine/threonine protein kinase
MPKDIARTAQRQRIVAGNVNALATEFERRGIRPEETIVKYKFGFSAHRSSDLDPGASITMVPASWNGDLENEFRLVCAIYGVVPEHAVRPYASVMLKDSHESPVAYVMEKLEGYVPEVLIGDLLWRTEKHPLNPRLRQNAVELISIYEQIVETLSKLHEEGIGHGDPHARNVLITAQGLKLFDPCKRHDRDGGDTTIEVDIKYMKTYESNIIHLQSLLRY